MTPELAQEIRDSKQELIDFLHNSPPVKWSSLVPIKPSGTRPPFFCFHGVGGNVLNYAVLSKYLDKQQPLYGLQSQGLDGVHPPLSSIKEMASHYITEIQSVQPSGPYHLGGGSMGGNIAFETALQLKRKGEKVNLLILFDTFGPNLQTTEGKKQARFGHIFDQMNGLSIGGQLSLLAVKVMNKVEFHNKIKKCEACLQNREPLPLELRLWYIEQQNYKALNNYAFKPYDDEILLLRSDMEKKGWYSDPKRGWEGIATTLIIRSVPGTHETLIEQPELGIQLNQALKLAQQKS